MSLNASIFPSLPVPTIDAVFNRRPPPGAGSAGGNPMDPYAMALDALLATERWRSATRRLVIGHSFGGMLAMHWWLRRVGDAEGRIDGMVLVGTTAGPMFDVVRVRVAQLGPVEWRVPVAPFMALWDTAFVTQAMDALLSSGGGAVEAVDFRTLRRQTDLAIGLAGWRGTNWEARRAFRAAMRGFDVRRQLAAITVPTIVLHGARDRLLPPDSARVLAAGLPDADLRIVPDAGHLLPLTHGSLIEAAVRDLL